MASVAQGTRSRHLLPFGPSLTASTLRARDRVDRSSKPAIAECGSSPDCSVVVRGLTAIIDLGVGRDGALHAVELDEDSWLAVELGQATTGTVNACDVWTGECSVVAHLPTPTAVASTRRHTYATVMSLVPGEADVVRIG